MTIADRRLARLAGSALIIVGLMAVPATAGASAEPPFQIRFPQETQVTVFSSTFGAGRSGGRRHHGVDLMAPKMTQVYAAADGVVTRIHTDRLGGRSIAIDHGDGWETRYMHLNNDTPGTDDGEADWSLTIAPGVVEGSRVTAGQLIAWSGDSGNAEGTGSHTHFEIIYDGHAIDPYPFAKAAWARDEARYEASLWEVLNPLGLSKIA